jgi:hypothetical protein
MDHRLVVFFYGVNVIGYPRQIQVGRNVDLKIRNLERFRPRRGGSENVSGIEKTMPFSAIRKGRV